MFDKVIQKLKRISSVNKVKPDPHFYQTFYVSFILIFSYINLS